MLVATITFICLITNYLFMIRLKLETQTVTIKKHVSDSLEIFRNVTNENI